MEQYTRGMLAHIDAHVHNATKLNKTNVSDHLVLCYYNNTHENLVLVTTWHAYMHTCTINHNYWFQIAWNS